MDERKKHLEIMDRKTDLSMKIFQSHVFGRSEGKITDFDEPDDFDTKILIALQGMFS